MKKAIRSSQYVFWLLSAGTYVTQVTATDADDPTYGNSARVVYSILHGQPYFSVDPKTGKVLVFFFLCVLWTDLEFKQNNNAMFCKSQKPIFYSQQNI